MYYQQDDQPGAFDKQAMSRMGNQKDYKTEGEPFHQKSNYIPGGVLSHYKKHINLTAQDIMEQDYFNDMADLHTKASEHMNAVSKNEKDFMAATRNLVTRTRMQRDVDWGSEDFRKKILTQDYGNYEKYEDKADIAVGGMLNSGANRIVVDHDDQDKIKDVAGRDMFQQNYVNMMRRMSRSLDETEPIKDFEDESLADAIHNEYDRDLIFKSKVEKAQRRYEQMDQAIEYKKSLKMKRRLAAEGIQYNGRMSPAAKEELYRYYLNGMTVKDLSLRYGILPQRVKAIVYQRDLYWNEVYPKLGETHFRMAIEREATYAQDFPFVDYGLDIYMMAQLEKGVELHQIKRSEIDANPPEHLEKEIEHKLSKYRCRAEDRIPLTFYGKSDKGYILRDQVKHKGRGSSNVSQLFDAAVRYAGSEKEHMLNNRVLMRMKAGGPRYAAMRKAQQRTKYYKYW